MSTALFTTNSMTPQQQPNGFAAPLVMENMMNLAPLTGMFANSTTQNYRSYKVEWEERANRTGVNYIIGVDDPKSPYIDIADPTWVTENVMFMVINTGEIMLVTSVNGRKLSVIRGYGGTTVRDINVSAQAHVPILRIGTAFPEGSERVTSFGQYTYSKYNYTQIFRNGWSVTRTALMTQMKTGQDLKAMLKKEALVNHINDIEMSMLYGVKASNKSQGRPLRTMDGIFRQIRTNIAAPANGVLTINQLDYFIERVFAEKIMGSSGNRRIAVCGAGFITLVNQLARQSTQYMVTGEQNYYGQVVLEWRTPHGTINLIQHEMLNQLPGRRNDLLLIHPDAVHIYYVYQGEDENEYGSGNNGVDASIGGLISECTILLKGEITCGWLTGICSIEPEPQRMMLVNKKPPVPNDVCVGVRTV